MRSKTPEPPVPRRRVSDSEREAAVRRLNRAFAEGRLIMEEFDERLSSACTATFDDELDTLLSDLPLPGDMPPAPGEAIELRTGSGTVKRSGDWAVPRWLRITSDSGTVRLDLTSATISHPVVDIELTVDSGTTVITLPRGATANVDALTTREGSIRSRVASGPSPEGPHLRVSGHITLGAVKLRYGLSRWRH
ncbi:hypothetical protein F4561_004640 [Lipingzhangella halophila]|uniref:DUF1707 domain-containing protein n=1 Tax=Lipingzhangella halophila TaxID=1783352 RepID=A0A7W7RKS6_9ACTN|nr:DUF1707 domain-containing protein [Lipingzhangella halophila]MBB4933820.1 hypothetical protein [Lipingzhangella halophila]